jgi:hypothetical protein
MQEICRVTVHDLSTGRVIATREFVGGKPPETICRHTDPSSLVFGSGCERQILGYVSSLLGSPE